MANKIFFLGGNGVAHSVEDILNHEKRSEPGKGILAAPGIVTVGFLSGVRWPGTIPCSMRIILPAHTLGSEWNVRFNTDDGPVEFDARIEGAVESKATQSQLTITMDKVPAAANSIEIESRLYNGIGSTLTERETLHRPE